METKHHCDVMRFGLLRRGYGMSSKVIAGFGLALALGVGLSVFGVSTTVLAFEEQKGAEQPASAANAAPAANEAAGQSLGVSDAQPGAAKEQSGTEVRIPGFGKLGVLPKMDFGLELLYGAADQKQPEATSGPGQTQDPDDLSIRGTVKHKF